MTAEELERVVMGLTGPVEAVGETHEDERRFQNLRRLTETVDRLLYHIKDAARDADRTEASMRKVGVFAKHFLQSVRDA